VKKWLLIPLDDRPCCWQFAQQLTGETEFTHPLPSPSQEGETRVAHPLPSPSQEGETRVIIPPRALLGHFQTPGDSEAILDWLDERAPQAEGAVVAIDMITWGGLVASRHPAGDLKQARARLQRLREIRERHQLKTLAFQTIMRNAPTQVRAEDQRFAELMVQFSQDPENQELRQQIPPQLLHEYMRVRQRNLRIYRDLVQDAWEFDYLVFALDDSKTAGWNLQELASLGEVNSLPGTDETALLLLTRALARQRKIQVDWSHRELPHLQGLYEDRPAGAVLEAQMRAAGLEQGSSNLQLWLYGRPGFPQQEARYQQTCPVDSLWLQHLATALEAGIRVVLVDLTFANGGDLSLAEALNLRGLWPKLAGYTAWNTLGNRVGTGLATLTLEPRPDFLAQRIADDLLYQAEFRWKAAQMLGHDGLALNSQEVEQVEREIFPLLHQRLQDFIEGDFQFRLPWNRLFEIEVTPRRALAQGLSA